MPGLEENTEITGLLQQLIVGYQEQEQNKIIQHFYALNANREAAEIIRELQQSMLMATQAKNDALKFLTEHGLKYEKDHTGQPAFKYSWDQHFMCQVIRLKIAGPSTAKAEDEHNMSYTGRTIEIKVLTSSANNNLNANDMLHVFESKYNAAISLLGKNKDLAEAGNLVAIRTKFLKKLNALPQNFAADHLQRTIKQNIALQREFIVELAAALIKAEKNDSNYAPNKKEIKAKIVQLRAQENVNVSNKPRDIIINCYPQQAEKNEYPWIINANYPQSNMSATIRTLKKKILSNWWHVKNHLVVFDDKNDVAKEYTEEFDRSSSLAQLAEKEHPDKANLELATIKNVLLQKAREQLIRRLNNGEPIPNNILPINFAAVTLLSPIGSKKNRRLIAKLLKPLRDTLIVGNEQEQLDSTRRALNAVSGQDLKFSPDDIKYIFAHVSPAKLEALNLNTAAFKAKLENLAVKPDVHYLNFPVNKIGPLPMERLDWRGYNKQYNAEGMRKLQDNIITYMDEFFNSTPHTHDSVVIDNIQYLLKQEVSRKNWRQIKNELEQYVLAQGKIPETLKEVLRAYIVIQEHLQDTTKTKNSRVSNAYMVAVMACHLNSLIGFESLLTCKSGKDRTGLLSVLKEIFLNRNTDLIDKNLIANIQRGIRLGASKDLNQNNTPGGRGLQVDYNILHNLVEFFGIKLIGSAKMIGSLIKTQRSRQVGSIPKAVYRCDTAIAAYLKKQPKTLKNSHRNSNVWPANKKGMTVTINNNTSNELEIRPIFKAVQRELNGSTYSFFGKSKYSITTNKSALKGYILQGPQTALTAITDPNSKNIALSCQSTPENIAVLERVIHKALTENPSLDITLTTWPEDIMQIAAFVDKIPNIKLPNKLFSHFEQKFSTLSTDAEQCRTLQNLKTLYSAERRTPPPVKI